MIGPVQSRCDEGSPVRKRSLRWEGFVEKVGFEPAKSLNVIRNYTVSIGHV